MAPGQGKKEVHKGFEIRATVGQEEDETDRETLRSSKAKKDWEVAFECTLKDLGKADLLHMLEAKGVANGVGYDPRCALGVIIGLKSRWYYGSTGSE